MEPLVVAAVGRVARIGELYDARTERFLHVSMAKDNLNSSVIQAIENKHSKIEYLKLNTLDEKLSALSVAAELKISVLCGLIQVGGSGKFVNDKKHSSKSVQVSLAANMLTEYEHVDFTNKNERKLIDMDILAEVDATHVVVGVQWGGNVFISVEDSNYEGSEYQSVQGSLSAKLEMLFASVSVGGSVSVNETLKNEVSKYSFEIYGDILPAEMPVTLVDAVALMKSSAKLLTDGNLGKGKAMSYTLLPLDFYRQLLGVEAKINSILRSINELTIEKCVKWFDDTNFVGQKVSDLLTDRKNYQNYIAKTKLDRIMTFGQQFDSYRFQVKASLAEHLQNIRSGNETVDQLIHILDAANNHEMARELIDFEQFRDIQSEIKFLKFLADRQINILDKDTSFQEFMLMHFNKNIYTFFYSIEFPSLSEGALVPFLTIVANKTYDSNGIFVAIKIDVLRDVERQTYFNFDGPTRLRLYKNQHCIVDNFLINTVVNSTGDSELWSLEYMKAQIINVRTEVAGAKIVVSGNVASITEIKNKLGKKIGELYLCLVSCLCFTHLFRVRKAY